jgi:hypothetical protein
MVRKILMAILLVASMMIATLPASAMFCWSSSDDDCVDNVQYASNYACIETSQVAWVAPCSYTAMSEIAIVGQQNAQISTGNVCAWIMVWY